MTDASQVLNRYLAVWNSQADVGEVFTEQARYVDPLVDVTGHEAIAATVAAARAQFPGWTFRPLGTAEAHHDQVRFSWELGPDGGDAPVAGSDVVTVGRDGRIASVTGFLDRVPA